MVNIMQYGLQRTGTNYIEYLLKENFMNFRFLNHPNARSLPIHKHFRLYSDKVFIPIPKYLNNFHYKTFSDFNTHVESLTNKTDIMYIITIKNPLAWYLSICKEAKNTAWSSYDSKFINPHFIIDYCLFYMKWIEFAEQSDKICIIKYEDILVDFENKLNQIKEFFNLKKRYSVYRNINKVPLSKKFTNKQYEYYTLKHYTSLFTEDELLILRENADNNLLEKMNYSI